MAAKVEPISLDAARQLIPDARTVILDFLVTEDRTYLFLFAKDGSSTGTIEQPAARVPRLVTRFGELLRGPDSKPEEAARELYDLLIRPIAPWLQSRQRLVVVPDAALWGLPFQALKSANERFLIQDFSVEYASSLTGLAALQRLDHPPAAASASGRDTLIAFGSPDSASGTAQLTLAGVTERGAAGGVEANREATAIAALFPKGSRAFVGRDATREAALGARARFVDFATMGRVSDTSPMRSKLFFAPRNSQETTLGTLDVTDFADWDPQAEVVALSRVESAVATARPSLLATRSPRADDPDRFAM
jgi:CHAT domain-containing protein